MRPGESGVEPLPTGEEVLTALRSAGWLLEQETRVALDSSGFNAVAGWAFPDTDDPTTSREIDVLAHRELFTDEKHGFSLSAQVLAECKQSSKPYVLIGRTVPPREKHYARQEHHFRFESVVYRREAIGGGAHRLHSRSIVDYLGLPGLPGSPYADTFEATQMTRLDRDKQHFSAVNSGIFTSLVYPLAKALTHQRSTWGKQWPGYANHDPNRGWAHMHLFFPVVVTSAPLFVVNVDEEGYVPRMAPWATMARQIQSKSVKGLFRIDVVNQDHLTEWIEQRVLTFSNAVASIAEAAPQRFVLNEDLNHEPTTHS